MKILFLTRREWPEIGGVQKHVEEVRKSLVKKGHHVRIISEKDLHFPKIKYLGLINIWISLFEKRRFIKEADVVHCHDVFIWYFPFRFIYPNKPVCVTFHGWEGVYPIPKKNIFLKKLASNLSRNTVAIGHYIEKYYGIKADKIIYGGQN